MTSTSQRSHWSWWYLLFLVEFVAVLWPPFYNSVEPKWHGIPFFYWYQLLWVVLSAVLTAIVYFATESRHTPSDRSTPTSHAAD
jgi:hypothetical protein